MEDTSIRSRRTQSRRKMMLTEKKGNIKSIKNFKQNEKG